MILYKTIYGIGHFVGYEKGTKKWLIKIHKPNNKGLKWIFENSRHTGLFENLGAFNENDLTFKE